MNRLDNINTMNQQTYGVEIEMANIERKQAAGVIANYFGTALQWFGEGYDKWGALDDKGRAWKCVRDGSFSGPEGSITCELVTPILNFGDKDDMNDLKEILKQLKALGARSGSAYNAGVHVHVGGKKLTSKQLKNLINMVYKRDTLIRNACGVDPNRTKEWCRPLPKSFIDEVNKLKGETLKKGAIEKLYYYTCGKNFGPSAYTTRSRHYNQCRYSGLNLHSLFSESGHGTCEFRYFELHGDLIGADIEAYVTMCVAMVSYASIVSACDNTPCLKDNSKHEMSCWLKNMGLVGSEFDTVRKRLVKRLEGDSAYATARNEI